MLTFMYSNYHSAVSFISDWCIMTWTNIVFFYFLQHNITPLHVAAKWGKITLVTMLIEKGANIEAKTRDGLTPLHCAARSGHDAVVDLLLERGAPISAKSKVSLRVSGPISGLYEHYEMLSSISKALDWHFFSCMVCLLLFTEWAGTLAYGISRRSRWFCSDCSLS